MVPVQERMGGKQLAHEVFLAGPPVAAWFEPSGWVRNFGGAAAQAGQGTGVKPPLQLFSRKSMDEKLFCIRLGGLMASVCPEDGR